MRLQRDCGKAKVSRSHSTLSVKAVSRRSSRHTDLTSFISATRSSSKNLSRVSVAVPPIAMAVLASSLPPGVSPPLTEDNDHNHNGLVVIVTSLALFLVLASLVIRLFASSKRGLMLQDDHVLFAAAICACIQVSLVLLQVHHGWGKSKELISSSDYTQMEKAGYAADLFYVLIIGLSKIGTMLFYQNLSLQRTKWMVNVIISSCGLWAMVAILLLAIRCSNRPWTDIDDACAGFYPRWQAICALDIVLEAVILAYPAITIRNVQISMSKKLKVLSILNCRIILIPLSAVHLYYIHSQIYSSNPSLVATYATMVAELHLSLSIVLLTVSCLKMFVAVYEDDHGFAYTEDASNSQSRSGRTPQKSWRSSRPVKDLGSFGSSCIEEEPILRTEATASASSPPLEGHQSNAILKSVQISVTRESIELGEIAGPSSAAIPRLT
ncbi:uncharacterized protein BO87DRAFT_363732 [Aspergillus neoniger CBS 115656]|uniref:Rhodopsin domain-containing protein n=1 Tax=Aspergillus neoniger (strain CBS 115656) TaxID=1448310 RepID=A0A318YC20_ASPNB|nr:hypothetical protein BO87DRAFT_363732 [Aspergillus neoniger CBS 115656]PYH31906.1 hypothetical protein BO87DRAFT_363732 [Aspergillus neoniger CBS 115656]